MEKKFSNLLKKLNEAYKNLAENINKKPIQALIDNILSALNEIETTSIPERNTLDFIKELQREEEKIKMALKKLTDVEEEMRATQKIITSFAETKITTKFQHWG